MGTKTLLVYMRWGIDKAEELNGSLYSEKEKSLYIGKKYAFYNPLTERCDDIQTIENVRVYRKNNTVYDGLAIYTRKMGWCFGINPDDILKEGRHTRG